MTHVERRIATPGRQAAVLLGGVIVAFLLGSAIGAPFDMDVGAGHAIFHVVAAIAVGAAAGWLWRHGGTTPTSRFAQATSSAFAVGQLAEGIAAIPDGSGDSVAHEITSFIGLLALTPLVLLSLIALVVSVIRRRRVEPKGA